MSTMKTNLKMTTKDANGIEKKWTGLSIAFTTNTEEADSFFKFAAGNTDVEFALVDIISNNTPDSTIFTSHDTNAEVFSGASTINAAQGGRMLRHIHNHPDAVGGYSPSSADTNLRRKAIDHFREYKKTPEGKDKEIPSMKFKILHKGTEHDYNE